MSHKLIFLGLIIGLFASFSCQKVEDNWQKAKTMNSMAAFQNLIKQFPNTVYADSAKDKILELDFIEAQKSNSIEMFENFISKYPDSRRTAMAVDALKKLKIASVNKMLEESFIDMCQASYSAAEELLLQCLKSDSLNSLALNNYAVIIARKKSVDDARPIFKKALINSKSFLINNVAFKLCVKYHDDLILLNAYQSDTINVAPNWDFIKQFDNRFYYAEGDGGPACIVDPAESTKGKSKPLDLEAGVYINLQKIARTERGK